jgi:hypothetical protein
LFGVTFGLFGALAVPFRGNDMVIELRDVL